MSLETWKAEFYPVDAKDVPEKDALAHSLQKWIGLRPENLARHGCKKDGGYGEYITDVISEFEVAADTCALCVHFLRVYGNCSNCPLSMALGGLRCDQTKADGNCSPYEEFIYSGNPEPMIALIEIAISKQ